MPPNLSVLAVLLSLLSINVLTFAKPGNSQTFAQRPFTPIVSPISPLVAFPVPTVKHF